MKTLAKVGVTNYFLWWALNGVSLQFACNKCGTTARESPYTDTILFSEESRLFTGANLVMRPAQGATRYD